jgi:ACR3 family arsenite efflux pump ArsB
MVVFSKQDQEVAHGIYHDMAEAVAAAISLFGFQSGAALATVVGVLIEVPVMLLVVRVVNSSKGWYERTT